jgi:hypothetical protein
MDLSFPIPVIGKVALSTHKRHSIQISKWRHTKRKRTVDFNEPTGTSSHNLAINYETDIA